MAATSALADATTALAGAALETEPTYVPIRVGRKDDTVVVDLGTASGETVHISNGDWALAPSSPFPFERTELTACMPTPVTGASHQTLLTLRRLLNVTDDDWPLLIGWLVAALMPDIPHPILMLGGEQGTGKSTAARIVSSLIDPSPAPLQSEPRDTGSWALLARSRWCPVIDNISKISTWWSDALCKAVTGDGWVSRKLYTNSNLTVLEFKRPIILTSIDAGALRGDLGERVLLVDLERIPEIERKTEAELHTLHVELHAELIGALFSAVARTLERLPTVSLVERPRMADFACVLAALDQACPELTGGAALERYLGQRGRIARDVVDSDPVAERIEALVEDHHGTWSGTMGDLHEAITPDKPTRSWPANGRALASCLKRIAPALEQVGIKVEKLEPRTNRGFIYKIEAARAVQSQQSLSPPETHNGSPISDCRDGSGGDGVPSTVTANLDSNPFSSIEHLDLNGAGDGSDCRDGHDKKTPRRRRVCL